MQDYFCPRCGRRTPEGHCDYCENRARRKASRPGAGGGTKEKIIPFESIKDSGERAGVKARIPGGGKARASGGGRQDIVLEFIDLGSGSGTESDTNIKAEQPKRGGKPRSPEPVKKKSVSVFGAVSRWFSDRIEAVKRFADELINPEEE